MQEEINPPSPEIVNNIQNILSSHDVFLSPDDVEVTVAAMCHWLSTHRRGQEYMAHTLQLDSAPGRNENKYSEKDGFGRLTKEIKTDSIVFLRGCIVNGESYPIRQVEVAERVRETCESCGCSTICLVAVEDGYGRRNICSRCAKADEDIRIREGAEFDCDACTDVRCSWNPVNVDAPPFEYGS